MSAERDPRLLSEEDLAAIRKFHTGGAMHEGEGQMTDRDWDIIDRLTPGGAPLGIVLIAHLDTQAAQILALQAGHARLTAALDSFLAQHDAQAKRARMYFPASPAYCTCDWCTKASAVLAASGGAEATT